MRHKRKGISSSSHCATKTTKHVFFLRGSSPSRSAKETGSSGWVRKHHLAVGRGGGQAGEGERALEKEGRGGGQGRGQEGRWAEGEGREGGMGGGGGQGRSAGREGIGGGGEGRRAGEERRGGAQGRRVGKEGRGGGQGRRAGEKGKGGGQGEGMEEAAGFSSPQPQHPQSSPS